MNLIKESIIDIAENRKAKVAVCFTSISVASVKLFRSEIKQQRDNSIVQVKSPSHL